MTSSTQQTPAPHAVPPFTLKQLAYFTAAADAGTIAEAAAALHVSASAMSDAITELETAMGERLCVRRRAHGLTLTPAGQLLMGVARRMLTEADELTHAMGRGQIELSGPVTIGCYPTLAPLIVPTLFQEFARLHPGVSLSIVEATQDQLADDFITGKIDVAFVYDTLVPGEMHRAKLFDLSAHMVLPAGHPLAEAPSVRLEDVIEEDLILLDAPPSGEHTLAVFTERGLRPRIRHRTASYEMVRTLVARGLGYGILVSRTANPLSYEGLPLVARTITPPVTPVTVEAIWAPDRPLTARSRALLDFAGAFAWPTGE
ncbi:DNA-binding transcriptional LysR family regulator [Leucobacter exalbidus]|uniref:DNA-binding transcriptional LysR family regulator n=1 Tax=Leucobacter exalbidus TaxID=662960 RepID=A0A940PX85_9MICO|nr:LysR substrate-binding domain-containing protein [Leucobacter exalbidus]MBP1326796.1 DNA-binding transcriptional LysR family regulator [Leucobacter exalbidus]